MTGSDLIANSFEGPSTRCPSTRGPSTLSPSTHTDDDDDSSSIFSLSLVDKTFGADGDDLAVSSVTFNLSNPYFTPLQDREGSHDKGNGNGGGTVGGENRRTDGDCDNHITTTNANSSANFLGRSQQRGWHHCDVSAPLRVPTKSARDTRNEAGLNISNTSRDIESLMGDVSVRVGDTSSASNNGSSRNNNNNNNNNNNSNNNNNNNNTNSGSVSDIDLEGVLQRFRITEAGDMMRWDSLVVAVDGRPVERERKISNPGQKKKSFDFDANRTELYLLGEEGTDDENDSYGRGRSLSSTKSNGRTTSAARGPSPSPSQEKEPPGRDNDKSTLVLSQAPLDGTENLDGDAMKNGGDT